MDDCDIVKLSITFGKMEITVLSVLLKFGVLFVESAKLIY